MGVVFDHDYLLPVEARLPASIDLHATVGTPTVSIDVRCQAPVVDPSTLTRVSQTLDGSTTPFACSRAHIEPARGQAPHHRRLLSPRRAAQPRATYELFASHSQKGAGSSWASLIDCDTTTYLGVQTGPPATNGADRHLLGVHRRDGHGKHVRHRTTRHPGTRVPRRQPRHGQRGPGAVRLPLALPEGTGRHAATMWALRACSACRRA